jgi:hypothetical protein
LFFNEENFEDVHKAWYLLNGVNNRICGSILLERVKDDLMNSNHRGSFLLFKWYVCIKNVKKNISENTGDKQH